MKFIERNQAPLFDETNEFGDPVVTHVFGVVRVGKNMMEYLYEVESDRDIFFRPAEENFPLTLKRSKKTGEGFIEDEYSIERYCDGMANFYHRILSTLDAGEEI